MKETHGGPGAPAPDAGVDALPDGLVAVGHPRELRGVWVATVSNIDWPSARGLSVEDQKNELVALLDDAREAGLNAVMLQVRPESDALYASSLEPWSRYLTGTQGQDPGWDPLAFTVAEAHARNLEVHAWVNPYRAAASATAPVAPTHVSRIFPEYAYTYRSSLWMDPGAPEVQDHIVSVVQDIVLRYDVDGIHLDDYFYPYPDGTEFPDDATYGAYLADGGTLSRADWRRDNVNRMVRRLGETLAQAAPHVRFGVSPFGIYRPGEPPGIVGLDQYEAIYSDPKLWKQMGWVDYLAPQLYWASDDAGQEFPLLIEWWASLGLDEVYTFAGVALYRGFSLDEYRTQIALSRAHAHEGSLGNIFFSMRHVSGPVLALLRDELYPAPALTPPLSRAQGAVMTPPDVSDTGNLWHAEDLRAYCLYRKDATGWTLERVLPGDTTTLEIPTSGDWALSAVGRHGVESPGVLLPPR